MSTTTMMKILIAAMPASALQMDHSQGSLTNEEHAPQPPIFNDLSEEDREWNDLSPEDRKWIIGLGYGQPSLVLNKACSQGKIDVVRYLLAQPDIDVNKCDTDGNSPLYLAIWYLRSEGEATIVKLLLESTDIDLKKPVTADGLSPLHYAFTLNNPAVFQALVSDPRVDVNAGLYGASPLHRAVRFKQEFVPILLSSPKIEVNAKSHNGQTPLMDAVADLNCSCLELLLADPRVDINLLNNKGETALCYARRILQFNYDKVLGLRTVEDIFSRAEQEKNQRAEQEKNQSSLSVVLNLKTEPAPPNIFRKSNVITKSKPAVTNEVPGLTHLPRHILLNQVFPFLARD